MSTEYVQLEGDVYRIVGSRVSLDTIVYAYWNSETAETIAQSFPVLTLEQVYGAITFYLANKAEVDRRLIGAHPLHSRQARGRPKEPRIVPYPRLRYGQVIKQRVGRRLVSVRRREIFGLEE